MHFGGIHFFGGLFFLLLSMLLICSYFLIVCLLLPLLQRGIAFFKQKGYADCWPILWVFYPEKRRVLLRLVVMVVLFFTIVYIPQRFIWMGNDNANYKAKEYFVAGQPLSGVRQFLCEYLNPENPILIPMNGLQRLIYHYGEQYLPAGDGEIGVWEDLWFSYPYIRRMHKPYGTHDFEPSYGMRNLLDRIYTSLEMMATKPLADQQMEQEKALLNFPRIALYFFLNQSYYVDKYFGGRSELLQRQSQVQKDAHLYAWIRDLRHRWEQAGLYTTVIEEQPKVEITRQMLEIGLGDALIYASIFSGEFSCENPLIPEYLEARRVFVDPKASGYIWGHFYAQDPQQAEDLYSMAIDGYATSFTKYILEHYCGYQVPGEERYYGKNDKEFFKKDRLPTITRVFQQELKIIEEGTNEH